MNITKTSDGRIHVSEAEKTVFTYTIYQTISGEIVWSDGNNDSLQEIGRAFAEFDIDKDGEIEFSELFEPVG